MTTAARLLIVMVLLVGATSFAAAEIVTSTGSVSFGGTGTQVLNVARFNTALGTLTGVTVTITHQGFNYFSVDNDDTVNAVSARANLVREWTITGTGVSTNGARTWRSSYVPLAKDDGDGATAQFTGADGYSWGEVGYASTSTGIDTSSFVLAAGNWSAYSGSGSAAFSVSSTEYDNYVGYDGTGPSEQQLSISVGNPGLGVGVSVEYQYDEPGVPEPSSLALLPMALGGLMFWRRRRRTG